jgi:hypothetical protein
VGRDFFNLSQDGLARVAVVVVVVVVMVVVVVVVVQLNIDIGIIYLVVLVYVKPCGNKDSTLLFLICSLKISMCHVVISYVVLYIYIITPLL